MKLLLTTTAITIAMGLTNPAVAAVEFTETNSTYSIDVVLTSQVSEALTLVSDAKSFYSGDFLSTSNAKLRTLTSFDMYNGAGSALVPTTRDVTD